MQTVSMCWFAKCDSLTSICKYGITSRIDATVYPRFVNLLSWYNEMVLYLILPLQNKMKKISLVCRRSRLVMANKI